MSQNVMVAYIFLVFLTSHIFLGCAEKPNPSPETMDPIYRDLVSKLSEAEKELEELNKTSEQQIADLDKTRARSVERKISARDNAKVRKKIKVAAQKLEYLKIRVSHRKMAARLEYYEAFKNKQPWPDPNEYTNYKTNERLRNSPLNWSSRVPKFKNNPNYQSKLNKE